MFKKYQFDWPGNDNRPRTLSFYVHCKNTRSGFMHRAIVRGVLPRLDENGTDYGCYSENGEKLYKARRHRVLYSNRTWESWPGQTCLSGLWKKLSELKFLDMSRVCSVNPFEGDKEPPYDDLPDPEELFAS